MVELCSALFSDKSIWLLSTGTPGHVKKLKQILQSIEKKIPDVGTGVCHNCVESQLQILYILNYTEIKIVIF